MKKIFSKKNMYIFFLLYTLLTISVSIYNLIFNGNYDELGFWHEIYRFFFLLALLFGLNIIKNFNFKKGFKSILDNLLPLLLTLLAFAGLLYFKGDLDLDMLKRLLMYLLFAIIAFALLRSIYSTFKTWIKDTLLSKRKKYFSMQSLIILLLLLLPIMIYYLVHGFDRLLVIFRTNNWYIGALILFILLVIALLISFNSKDQISLDIIICLLVYYIVWFVIGFNNLNIYTIELMQLIGFIVLFLYEKHNKLDHCVPLSLLIIVLISIGAYFHFN